MLILEVNKHLKMVVVHLGKPAFDQFVISFFVCFDSLVPNSRMFLSSWKAKKTLEMISWSWNFVATNPFSPLTNPTPTKWKNHNLMGRLQDGMKRECSPDDERRSCEKGTRGISITVASMSSALLWGEWTQQGGVRCLALASQPFLTRISAG